MNNDEILEVVKTEHHYWQTCPCAVCDAYRAEQAPTPNHIKAISPEAAHFFGYFKTRNPHGSLARQLMNDQN